MVLIKLYFLQNDHCRLGRTSEFLIYGHGQQRRAVVEAVRLTESNSGIQSLDNCEKTNSSVDINIKDFKEKSQKWQKFVTQVCGLVSFCFLLFHVITY